MTARGRLRVLLGAAPGVGTTYAMLAEGARLREEGRDVVIATVRTRGRAATAEAARGLDAVAHGGGEGARARNDPAEAVDVEAVLARHPDVALVDALAGTNPVGSRHLRRWQDVEDLLDAGIDVVSTLTIAHIESLSGVVAEIIGAGPADTVPDTVLRAADRVEVVDLSPQSLLDRLRAGLVDPASYPDLEGSRCFQLDSLIALRELALLWVADDAEEALRRYRDEHSPDAAGQPGQRARECVVVALDGASNGEGLLRRGARIVSRSAGAELLAVHVAGQHRAPPDPDVLASQRALAHRLGAGFHEVVSDDVPGALIDFAHSVGATQIIIGAARRRRPSGLARPGVGERVARRACGVDVRIVTRPQEAGAPLPRPTGALSQGRRLAGFAVAVVAGPLLTRLLAAGRIGDSITVDALLYQLLVVVVALTGGIVPALVTAVGLAVTLDYFFVAPLHTIAIGSGEHLATVVLYSLIAVLVSLIVDRAARQTRVARRSAAESLLLQSVSSSVLGGQDAVQALLDRTREAFGLARARLTRDGVEVASSSAPRVQESIGTGMPGTGTTGPGTPGPATAGLATAGQWRHLERAVGDRARLEVDGPALDAGEQRLLSVIAVQLAAAMEQADLAAAAASDKMRTALLSALGHDLRRPLASATAAVSGLRTAAAELSDADRAELVETADQSLAALSGLIDDLLDVRRLETGALAVSLAPTEIDDVVEAALDEIGAGPRDVGLDIGEGLPEVPADPALLRRVLVNLLNNGLRHRPAGTVVQLSARAVDDMVELRVADHGPGIDPARRDEVFVPFQRLGDTDNTTGLGLGLALSKGFTEGMGGTLVPEDTPGGGLTMVISLPLQDQPGHGQAQHGQSENTLEERP